MASRVQALHPLMCHLRLLMGLLGPPLAEIGQFHLELIQGWVQPLLVKPWMVLAILGWIQKLSRMVFSTT